MARLSFRDRFFTPPVARAMMSPGGILLAAAGVSAGILAALPVAACVGLGAAAWAGRVAFAVPREAKAERIDPFTLQDPWRRYVQESLQAQKTFDEAVRRSAKGPLRDRLDEIADRLQTGTSETWRIARHAQALSTARRSVDVNRITYDLQQLGPAPTADPGSATARTFEALQAQLGTAQRMDTTLADAESRLRLLDARLDEAVTRAIELSVQAHDVSDLAGLQGEVDSVVSDMEALRLALREADSVDVVENAQAVEQAMSLPAPPQPQPQPQSMPPLPPPPTTEEGQQSAGGPS